MTPFLTPKTRIDNITRAIRRIEIKTGLFSSARRTGNGFELTLLMNLLAELSATRRLNLSLGDEVAARGVTLRMCRRLADTSLGPIDLIATGPRGEVSCFEVKALRRQQSRTQQIKRIRLDRWKLHRVHRRRPCVALAQMAFGLGYSSIEFQDLVREALPDVAISFAPVLLLDGSYLHVAIANLRPWSDGCVELYPLPARTGFDGQVGMPTARVFPGLPMAPPTRPSMRAPGPTARLPMRAPAPTAWTPLRAPAPTARPPERTPKNRTSTSFNRQPKGTPWKRR